MEHVKPEKDERNKGREETSAEKYKIIYLLKASEQEQMNARTKLILYLCFLYPKTFRIHLQGRSLARGSGGKYENCLGLVNLLNFQTQNKVKPHIL